ncbi:MAG: hypothetical protein PUP46_06025 [Endozoicomonas sp. (ex Botrylloides leachii)]|nr:hypothetical protein [Endozoicomonas sp. (ex Botrylloides leachii)]
MKHTDFINLLESLTLLTDEQLHVIQSAVDGHHLHGSLLYPSEFKMLIFLPSLLLKMKGYS